MKKKNLLIIIITITFFSCKKTENNNQLEKLIDKELTSIENVKETFLNLKFGMCKVEYDKELKNLNLNNKIEKGYSGYSYEFIQNKKLNGINWLITSKLHNDTIIGINLHAYKKFWKNNYNSLNETYNEIIEEYRLVYGEPSLSNNRFENYWVKNNLLISITKSEKEDLGGTVYIKYSNKRK